MKRILLLTDNKAGHEALSRGVVEHLRVHYEIDLDLVRASLRPRFVKSLFPWLLKWVRSGEGRWRVARLIYADMPLNSDHHYHLVVSAGGTTAFLNTAVASFLNVPNLYLSSLRGIAVDNFSYVVSLLPADADNVIEVELAPVYVQEDEQRAAEFMAEKQLQSQPVWSVLVGGATDDYRYTPDHVKVMLDSILSLAQKQGAKVLLTSSRRSGSAIETEMEKAAREWPSVVADLVLFGRKPEKVAGLYMSIADRIILTEDSGSMITESILARKPVFTCRNADSNPVGVYKQFIQQNVERKYMKSLVMTDITETDLDTDDFRILVGDPFQPILEKIRPLMEKSL